MKISYQGTQEKTLFLLSLF